MILVSTCSWSLGWRTIGASNLGSQIVSSRSHGGRRYLSYDLTTQSPFEIWMAIDGKARSPKEDIIPLGIVRFSGKALTAGVETHSMEGVKVKVYNPAKTVADCFKYRNKIGLDVAIEALRDCWRKKRATTDQLWHYAKVCRVARVMRPYLESLV